MKFFRDSFILLIFYACLFAPINSYSGSMGPTYLNPETDNASFQLFYYWDLRNRDSSFQVFNKGTEMLRVHVQIFTANSAIHPCEEINFIDQFTPQDTHVYNLRNITRNSGSPLSVGSLSDGTFGFAVITALGPTGFDTLTDPVLLGSFRIIDESGYEYRANPVGVKPIGFTTETFAFNFASYPGQSFSDVVGIPVIWTGTNFRNPVGGSSIVAVFSPEILDENEFVTSCSEAVFSCSATGMNLGINNSIRNSKTNTRICPTSQNTGMMRLKRPFTSGGGAPGITQAAFFVGFIGLNDGGQNGSMDSFIAVP